jgi:hypothetical protein
LNKNRERTKTEEENIALSFFILLNLNQCYDTSFPPNGTVMNASTKWLFSSTFCHLTFSRNTSEFVRSDNDCLPLLFKRNSLNESSDFAFGCVTSL